MRTKKRAKAVKFGKKAAVAEEKKEEKISEERTVTSQSASASMPSVQEKAAEQTPVKEVAGSEEKHEPQTADVIVQSAEKEKAADQVNQETVQVKGEANVTPVQNQEVVAETPDQTTQPVVQENQTNTQELSSDEEAYTVQTDVEKNLVRYFIIIAVISFLVGIISMAGVSIFLQRGTIRLPFISSKIAEATPSPAPTITPEPTKTAVINLSEYNIEVLNGSGVTGAASKLKTELTTDGYKVLSAGNADKSDYSETVISAKKEVSQEYLKKLKESLGKQYILAPESKTPLSGSSEADVVITIGSGIQEN